ncbi:MAG: hypothetical protein KKG60_01720 [Nanoarchaeota archaeon]|nr:hypothetical protein [Nanoarchaeota archaeon]
MEKQGNVAGNKKVGKKKKPKFNRQDNFLKKFRKTRKWRNPRGIHNKVRLQKKGHRKSPSRGYRAPESIKGMHPSGLKVIIVFSKKDLVGIDKNKQGALISHSVGLKNKLILLEEAGKLGIKILNIKDVELFMKKKKEELEKRKDKKKKRETKKEKFKKEAEKRAETKKMKEQEGEKKTEEEKQKESAMEKKKVLEDKKAVSKGGMVA